MNKILLIACIYSMTGCIEPYDFVIKDKNPMLVVEGFISDISFNETLNYPSDGRYFTVKLSYTNEVSNTKGGMVSGALINLLSDSGVSLEYNEIAPGNYVLLNQNFKATGNTRYKLHIQVAEDEIYESDWVALPSQGSFSDEMGDISFREVEIQHYRVIANEEQVITIKGIQALINLPKNNLNTTVYYKWNYAPTWIYIAPLARASQIDKKCWASNPYYLNDYSLQADFAGGYKKDLFFIETDGNERIYEEFSVLVTQQILTEDFYFFYKELQESEQEDALSGKPPANLLTNIASLGGDKKVSGYFGAVREKAQRWYFNKDELSYYTPDDLEENCIKYTDVGGPAPECLSCLEYSNGNAFLAQPSWWNP